MCHAWAAEGLDGGWKAQGMTEIMWKNMESDIGNRKTRSCQVDLIGLESFGNGLIFVGH